MLDAEKKEREKQILSDSEFVNYIIARDKLGRLVENGVRIDILIKMLEKDLPKYLREG